MDADTEPPSEPLRQTATRQLMSWVAIGAAVLAAFWLVAMIIDAVAALVTGTYEHLVRLPKVPRDTFWAWFAVYSGLVALTGLVVARARRLRLVFNQLIWSIAAVVIPLLMLTWPVSYTSVSRRSQLWLVPIVERLIQCAQRRVRGETGVAVTVGADRGRPRNRRTNRVALSGSSQGRTGCWRAQG